MKKLNNAREKAIKAAQRYEGDAAVDYGKGQIFHLILDYYWDDLDVIQKISDVTHCRGIELQSLKTKTHGKR